MMLERDLQEATRRLFEALWDQKRILEFHHQRDSRRSRPGWPDWCLAIRKVGEEPLVIWIELKGPKGKLTPAQERWMAALGRKWHLARTLDDVAAILARYDVEVDLNRKWPGGGP